MPKKYSRLPWGKTHRKLPPQLEQELAASGGRPLLVACAKKITAADFAANRYQHLEIIEEDDLSFDQRSILPSPNVGRTSYLNAVVEEVRKKVGGKVLKTIHGTAPSRGTWVRHPTKRTVSVWPKDMVFPAMSHLNLRPIERDPASGASTVRFQVEEVLDPQCPGFKEDLLRCVNLLLENVGVADVFPIDVSEAELLRRAYESIGWELLPGGSKEEVTDAVVRRIGKSPAKFRRHVTQRIAVLDALRPERWFQGGGHFTSYLAAQFTKELVAFENLYLGAIYVMRSDWQTLSQLSRSELLRSQAGRFERIVHVPGWDKKLGQIVRRARGEIDEPGVSLL